MENPLDDAPRPTRMAELDTAEITALAHLYRAEVTRSTAWRTRLDTTTNWAVVTLGIALSIAFAAPNASPIPLVLVGILIVFFLMLEARRYRYYNVWRARTRWMETRFFAPLLLDGPLKPDTRSMLAQDYVTPKYHVSLIEAVGRRRNTGILLTPRSPAAAAFPPPPSLGRRGFGGPFVCWPAYSPPPSWCT